MTHSMPRELIFERSIARTATLLGGSLLMTGLSYYLITRQILDFAFKAWLLGLILGPIAIFMNVLSLFRGGTQVVFDEDGISDLRKFWGLISWSEILSIEVVRFYGNRFLCICLIDEPARISRLSVWGRISLFTDHVKDYPAFKIRFQGLTPGIDEAWAYLQTHHPEKLLASPTEQPLAIGRP